MEAAKKTKEAAKVITIGRFVKGKWKESDLDGYINNVISQIEGFRKLGPDIVYNLPIYYKPDWSGVKPFESSKEEGAKIVEIVQQKLKSEFSDLFEKGRINVINFTEILESKKEDKTCGLSLGYLQKLERGGQIIDLIKNFYMIQHGGKNNHLCIDDNIQIFNYKKLYECTFNSKDEFLGGIKLSTSNYSPTYLAPNNKIMYLPAKSEFCQELMTTYLDEISNVLRTENEKEIGSIVSGTNCTVDQYKNRNMMYTRVYCQAIRNVGLGVEATEVKARRLTKSGGYANIEPNKTCAILSEKTSSNFEPTKYIIHTRNQSWKSKDHPDKKKIIKGHPGEVFKDCVCELNSNNCAFVVNSVKINYNTYVASIKGITSVLYNHQFPDGRYNFATARKDFDSHVDNGSDIIRVQISIMKAYLQAAVEHTIEKIKYDTEWNVKKGAQRLSGLLQQIPSEQFGDNLKYALSSQDKENRKDYKKNARTRTYKP